MEGLLERAEHKMLKADELYVAAMALDITPEDLDEVTHDAASKLASDACNRGIEDQIDLIVRVYGPVETVKILRDVKPAADGERATAALRMIKDALGRPDKDAFQVTQLIRTIVEEYLK